MNKGTTKTRRRVQFNGSVSDTRSGIASALSRARRGISFLTAPRLVSLQRGGGPGVGRGVPTSEGLCLVRGTLLTSVQVLPARLVFTKQESPEN